MNAACTPETEVLASSNYHVNKAVTWGGSFAYLGRKNQAIESKYSRAMHVPFKLARELGEHLNAHHPRAFWLIMHRVKGGRTIRQATARGQNHLTMRLICSASMRKVAKEFLLTITNEKV